MSRLSKIAWEMRKLSSKLRDIDVLLSADPGKIARRVANKAIGRKVRDLTRNLFLRPPRRRP